MQLLCIGFAILCSPLSAQDTTPRDSAPSSTQGLVLESIGIAPQSYWSSDGLLIVRCGVKNTGSIPAVGFLVGRAVGNLGNEDRRRVELEPQHSRNYEFQIRLPVPLPESKVDVEVSLIAVQNGKEVLVVSGSEPATRTLSFWRQEKNRFVTALAMGREPVPPLDWRWESARPFATSELALASRIDGELSRNCIAFEAMPFPLNPVDWKYIDTLILADPEVLKDSATVSVLRSFLFGGGRIWVMLDAIDTNAIEGLLTGNQQCTTIDTIEIDHFVVDETKQTTALVDRTVVLDEPVRLKKVLQQGGAVTHSIDGWPVGLMMSIGRGELFLTTLESPGWIEPRVTQWSTDPNFQSEYQIRRWARGVVDLVHSKRAAPLIQPKDVSYPLERIGNPIVSRQVVASVLVLFCTSLVAYGLWRIWEGELKWIGWVAPALALAATIPLIAIAWLQKRDIPSMVSLFQLVQFENPIGGSVRETAAVYSNGSGSMELRGSSGGFVTPDPGIASGVTTITTDDFQIWRMNNVAWPTGVWKYTSETTVPNATMLARGELTPDGLTLQIPDGLPSPLQDAVLSYMPGTSTLGKPLTKSSLLFDGAYPAEGERWTLDSIVDDEQRRRSAIYKGMLENGDRLQIPIRTLFGWTDMFSSGPQWDAPIERRGVALVAMPVAIETPEIGSEVRIPYSLIEVRNANLGSSSPIYLDSVGRWIAQSSNSSDSSLEFILPEEAIPLEVSSLAIDWDVQAPRRKVRLSCVDPSESVPIEVAALNEPSLPWLQTITDPRILKAFGDGRIVLKIEVSEDRDEGSSTPWRIKHLRMSVTGKTLPKNRLVTQSSP